jgi:hypothetical protein
MITAVRDTGKGNTAAVFPLPVLFYDIRHRVVAPVLQRLRLPATSLKA